MSKAVHVYDPIVEKALFPSDLNPRVTPNFRGEKKEDFPYNSEAPLTESHSVLNRNPAKVKPPNVSTHLFSFRRISEHHARNGTIESVKICETCGDTTSIILPTQGCQIILDRGNPRWDILFVDQSGAPQCAIECKYSHYTKGKSVDVRNKVGIVWSEHDSNEIVEQTNSKPEHIRLKDLRKDNIQPCKSEVCVQQRELAQLQLQLHVNAVPIFSTHPWCRQIETYIVTHGLDENGLYLDLYARDNLKFVDASRKVYYGYNDVTKLYERGTNFNENTEITSWVDKQVELLREHLHDIITPDTEPQIQQRLELFQPIKRRPINLLECVDENFRPDSSDTLIPIADGNVIDLETLIVRPRTCNDYFSKALNVRYLGKQTPTIDKYMLSLVNGNEVLRKIFQILLGYMISGVASPKIVLIWSSRHNSGTSVLANLIWCTFGHLVNHSDSRLISGKGKQKKQANNPLATFRTTHINIDHSDSESNIGVKKLTRLCSGDEITCHNPRESDETFINRAKHIFIRDRGFKVGKGGEHLARVFPFNAQFEDTRETRQYVEDIRNNYLDEFFTYACNGGFEFFKDRVIPKIPK